MSEEEEINEVIYKNSEIKEIDKSLNKVCKSICKIIFKNRFATGFLIKLFIKEKELYCLITNQHVIEKEMVESNEFIDVYYNYEDKWIKIKLDKIQRLIKYDLEKDFTIIEIIPNDKIKEKYFLLPDIKQKSNDLY